MSVKLMIFIDGSWLFHNLSHLRDAFGDPDYIIDYKKLPKIIASHIGPHLSNIPVDIVRINFFGAMPQNKPGFDPIPQKNFFDFLEKDCLYTMEIYDIDFKYNSDIHPQEKCVDIALATSVMSYMIMPNSYDVAAIVAGDLDYMPLMRRVRMLGKRVQLVAMKAVDNYAPSSEKLVNDHELFDFPVLYLDDHLEELRLVREKKLRVCEICNEKQFTFWDGPSFLCPICLTERSQAMVRTCQSCGIQRETSWKGEIFYCDICREKHRTGRW
jgi:hypothetical protein